MKRYISNPKRVYGGLSFDENEKPIFDWYDDDSEKDVVNLKADSSGSFDKDDVRYIYGYQYNSKASETSKKMFRKFIKNTTFDDMNDDDVYDAVDDFIDFGVLKIEKYADFNDFGALVHIGPSKYNSLVEEIGLHIANYTHCIYADFSLIKMLCKDVELDIQKIKMVLENEGYPQEKIIVIIKRIQKAYDPLVNNGKTFTMKKFLPRIIRDSFEDFLIFKNDDERKVYNALQGVDVLIYDDFLTDSTTIREIIRCLKSIHDENRLTVFVLVKQ